MGNTPVSFEVQVCRRGRWEMDGIVGKEDEARAQA